MKTIISFIAFLTLISVPAFASDWCDGYRQGYIDAYKNEVGVRPPTPPCRPIIPRKPGAPRDDYTRGYLTGTKAGIKAAMKAGKNDDTENSTEDGTND